MPRRTSKKNAQFPLLDHLDELLERLANKIPAAFDKFETDAVHDVRVATRRFAAALGLIAPVLSKEHRKPLLKGLKQLRRRLGPLRDADVMLVHLAQFKSDATHGSAAAWLSERVNQNRTALRQKSADGPSASKSLGKLSAWTALRAEVTEARDAIDSLLAESLHLQVDAFAEQADRLSASLLSPSTKQAAETSSRPNPHEVRIVGKALRYTLEMAQIEGHSPGKSVMKSFKQMQEQLGAWHDYVVLSDTAMEKAVGEELTHLDPATALQVLELSRAAVRQSIKDLATFAKLWRRHGETIVAKIRAAFPLTFDVSSKNHGLEQAAGADDPVSQVSTHDHEPLSPQIITESETGLDLVDSAPSEEREAIRSTETPAA